MGAFGASVSRTMFDELKRYVQTVVQMGIPWVDADENDRSQMLYTYMRRAIQKILGDGSPNDGFKIVGTGASNDFTVKGGDGSAEGAGRMWVGGHPCVLASDETYKAVARETAAVSTGLTATVLTDSAANFTYGGAPNNLVGRSVVPNIANGTAFVVTANTQTTITTAGNMTTVAATGQKYRVELSTPGGARTDTVFLDVYLDEISAVEDANLLHNLGTNIEAQRRLKVIEQVLVREGGVAPAAYLDSDGHRHEVVTLATIARTATAVINVGDVTDTRPRYTQSIQDLLDEVIAARGTQPSLDARLDVSLNEDGTLKPAAAFGGAIDLSEIDMLRPHAQTVANDTIFVEAGRFEKVSGSGSVLFAGGSSPAFPVIAVNPRKDLIVVDDTGVLVRVAGVEAVSPVAPAYPADKTALAEVLVTELVSVVVSAGDVTDVRPFFTKGVGAVTQEVVNARGSQPSLDARLDTSLNEDGTLKPAAIIQVGGSVWEKYVVTEALFTAAATTESVSLFSLPARGAIEGVVIRHTASFAGGGITAFTLELGVAGAENRFATAFNVFQVPGATVGDTNDQLSVENFVASTSVLVTARSSGGNVADAIVGSAEIWVKRATLPA